MTVEKVKTATETALLPQGGLSGLKSWIGLGLLLASGQLDVINDVAMNLCDVMNICDVGAIEMITSALESVISVGERILEFLGSGFLGIGLVDKARKLLKGLLA